MALYAGDSQKRTRLNLMDIFPRGTQGDGNANNLVGSGGDIPLVIKVPTAQSVDAFEIQTANGTVLFSINQAGQHGYLGGVLGGGEQCVQFSLTAAQIIAMEAAPITIVPAPGAGYAICVTGIVVVLTLTSTAFTGGGVVHFYYHGQTTEIMAQTIAAATVQGGAATTVFQLMPVQTAGGSVVTPAVGIDITNATAPFAAGTGTAVVTIWYTVIVG